MSRYSIEDLLRILPPDPRMTEDFTWDPAAQRVDTRLPTDYEQFLRRYGPGEIERYFGVEPPAPVGMCHGLSVPPEEYLAGTESPYPAFPEAGGLIVIGGDADADDVFYLTTGDPDDWIIAVQRRQHGSGEPPWKTYDCGLIDFLVRMARREFDANPFHSADALWGRDAWRFRSEL